MADGKRFPPFQRYSLVRPTGLRRPSFAIGSGCPKSWTPPRPAPSLTGLCAGLNGRKTSRRSGAWLRMVRCPSLRLPVPCSWLHWRSPVYGMWKRMSGWSKSPSNTARDDVSAAITSGCRRVGAQDTSDPTEAVLHAAPGSRTDNVKRLTRQEVRETVYNTPRWKALRLQTLNIQPICPCGRLATMVHHVQPIRRRRRPVGSGQSQIALREVSQHRTRGISSSPKSWPGRKP